MPPEPPPAEGQSPPAGGAGKQGRLFAGALPRVVASLLIAAGFVWLLARGGLPLLPDRTALSRIPSGILLGFLASQVAGVVLRTYRWVFLLRPLAPHVKPLRVMGMGLVGFSAIFLAPLRMGEIVRPYLIAQDGEVSFMQAAGTIFAERVIDGVVLTVSAALALSLSSLVSPLPTALGDIPLPLATVPAALYSATLAFVGLFLTMAAFYAAREQARRLTRRVLGVVSLRLADWVSGTLERIADGLRFLPSSSNLVSFVGTTIVYWGVVFAGQWLLMRGVGLDASFSQACTMVGVLGLGVIVPAGPGLFGAFQIASFSALALFFPLDQVRGAGSALVFVAYVVTLALSVLQSVFGFLLMARVPAGSPPAAA